MLGAPREPPKILVKIRFGTVLLGSGGLWSPDVLLPPKLSLCTGFPSHPHLPEILLKLFLDSVLCDGDTCSVSPADVLSNIAVSPICKESEASNLKLSGDLPLSFGGGRVVLTLAILTCEPILH